jgi:hypothetical protein
VVLLDHEGGKDISRDNKVVVFNRDGDPIMSRSTRLLGNAVKDACAVITQSWSGIKARQRYSQPDDDQQAKAEEKK